MEEAREELAEMTRQIMGEPLDVDPMDALLWCIRITAGEVAYASHKISELTEEDVLVRPTEVISREGGGANVADYEEKTFKQELNIWVQVRQTAVDRLAKFSKMALDAGVAERAVRLAETAGEGLAVAIRHILTGLNLTYEQELLAPDLVREALETLEGPSIQGQALLHAPQETREDT